jgi:HAD superfamily hydrolase (TIGR01509 family)
VSDDRRIRAVLFDLDGTLVDSIPFLVECFSCAVRDALGHKPEPEEVRPLVGLPLRTMFERFHPNLTDELANACVATYRDVYFPLVVERSPLFPDALEVLDRLEAAGLALGIVSGKTAEGILRVVEPIGIAHRFGAIVGADHGGAHKPAPDGALAAAEMLGVAPAETAVVGDSLLDVEMALAAGMLACGVTTGTTTRDALAARAHVVADSLAELVAEIDSHGE